MEKQKGRKAYERIAKDPKLLKVLDKKGFTEYWQRVTRDLARKTDFYEKYVVTD